jgi:hypothetical protein
METQIREKQSTYEPEDGARFACGASLHEVASPAQIRNSKAFEGR